MGATYWEREGTLFPRNPIGVLLVSFSAKPKNSQVAPQNTVEYPQRS
jgi:hypothetical protein